MCMYIYMHIYTFVYIMYTVLEFAAEFSIPRYFSLNLLIDYKRTGIVLNGIGSNEIYNRN